MPLRVAKPCPKAVPPKNAVAAAASPVVVPTAAAHLRRLNSRYSVPLGGLKCSAPTTGATLAWIGLGANLGERTAALRQAVQALAALPGTSLLRTSSLYRSAPVDAGGPDYLNAVADIATPDLTVPHPRMFERAFVLRPLAELAPQQVPAQALQAVQGQAMEWCQGPEWAD